MNAKNFGSGVLCHADGDARAFLDGYELDAVYLATYRPKSVTIHFQVLLSLRGRVEVGPDKGVDNETVVVTSKYGESRTSRNQLSVQWKRNEPTISNFILKFQDVRDGLTDRKCIWVTPSSKVSIAHFTVHPRAFSANESISELIEQAKECIQKQLLSVVQPA
jgi:hypothetical protein